MAYKNHHFSFLFISLTTLFISLSTLFTAIINPITTATASPSPPSLSPSPSSPPPPPHSPSPPPPPPPSPKSSPPPSSSPPSPTETPQQLNNIIDTLIGAGEFGNWVNIITGANPLSLPLSATFFIPQDDALNRLPTSDPFMFPYHVVPQRLTFADLQLFESNSRLPTLLPGKSILITNASASNFTLDGALLIQPDLYVSTTMAVHGVGAVLEYSVYGDGLDLLPKPNSEHGQHQQPSPPPPSGVLFPMGEIIGGGWRSDAAPPCHCVEFPVGCFLVACVVWVFKFRV